MHTLESLPFDNSFGRLSEAFYSRLKPTPLQSPYLISFNPQAAELIGLDPAEAGRADFTEYLGGTKPIPGSDPLAMVYAGHQFGHYVPQLGDGRAIVLGEVKDKASVGWELQLKGAGLTPYSRDGDGRAVLRSTIREYLCSEAMAGLGIPTTRALCMLGSEEEVYREQIETGALLLRMAPSHVRFGSFEFFYYSGQYDQLSELADYVIAYHFPQLAESKQPYLELLREVVLRTARLMTQWQLVGFAHGVMNTDNMSILGLTLDYGPFGFLDSYDPGFICNHSDHHGRYAFDQQPQIGLWNLSCFAQTLLPLLDRDNGQAAAEAATAVLQEYEPELLKTYARGMRDKLGLRVEQKEDQVLSADLLGLLHANQVDYTNFFRGLAEFRLDDTGRDSPLRDQFIDRAAFDAWARDYRTRLTSENSDDDARRNGMNRVNPKYILRNYLAQQAIEKAEQKDFSEIDRLLKLLARPFDEQPEMAGYAEPPPDWASKISVSCSS